MKLFLAMQLQAQGATPEEIQQLVGNYPAFSNGITLEGTASRQTPKRTPSGPRAPARAMAVPIATVRGACSIARYRSPTRYWSMFKGLGQAEMPVWRWVDHHAKRIVNLGLKTANEDIATGTADIDIAGDRVYLRPSRSLMVLNWFDPRAKLTLNGTELTGLPPLHTRG